MMVGPERMTTPRLVLRRWTSEDRAPFAALNSDPEVMRYFPATLDREESDAFVDRIAAHFELNGHGLWAVEVDGTFAGYTGLNRTAFDTPMGPHIEIGWRFARWAWGNGYSTEAARAVLEDAFVRVGETEIFSFTTVTNRPSENVMIRIGMKRRPEYDFDHPRTPDWWGRRHLVYSIGASDWRLSR